METIVISGSQTLEKFEGKDVFNARNFIEAARYIEDNKGKIKNIILKDIPEDGITLTDILHYFTNHPAFINNIILYLTDTHIDYSDYANKIELFEEKTNSEVKFGQIEEKNKTISHIKVKPVKHKPYNGESNKTNRVLETIEELNPEKSKEFFKVNIIKDET